MTPVGRGQRQLIIGDRKTGKTAVCTDTIINQREAWETGDPEQQVRCVYVAVGQKGTTIAGVRQALEDAGAMDYTTIVAAPASDPAGFKYIAPYAGSAIAQHWMFQGKHCLIVFDDLSKQAEAYRAISLLLRRPPGREAYPGDVFYLHSRLLERCAKLNDELGAGSLTGLPIVETKGGDIAAYIPTNVISITDGQCFLEADLFNQGQRPALNVGNSVSRVGGDAQIKAMKSVAGRLRVELAQYRELESFAAFGSDLDATSQAQLDRGARLMELLKQGQGEPYPVEEEVVGIFLGTRGHLDSVPVEDVSRFETEFLEHVRRDGSVLAAIRDTGKLSDEDEERLNKTVSEFKQQFATESGEGVEDDGGTGELATGDDSSDESSEGSSEESSESSESSRARTGTPTRLGRVGRELERVRGLGRERRLGREELDGMAASLRVLRRRIRSTKNIAQITKAMEMVAASRIVKAQTRVHAARPYSDEFTHVLTTAAKAGASDHPLLVAREEPGRTGVLVVTSDRGLCGGYNANVLREAERLMRELNSAGKEPQLFVIGGKGTAYFRFRKRAVGRAVDGLLRGPRLPERHPGRGHHDRLLPRRERRDGPGRVRGRAAGRPARARAPARVARAVPRGPPRSSRRRTPRASTGSTSCTWSTPRSTPWRASVSPPRRSPRWSWRRTTSPPTASPTGPVRGTRRSGRPSTSSSRSPRCSSTGSCPSTSARACSRPCSTPRRPSRRPGSAP